MKKWQQQEEDSSRVVDQVSQYVPIFNMQHVGISSLRHNLPVSACSNEITAFPTSTFDAPPPANLNMQVHITFLRSQSHYYPILSRDDYIQSSP